MKAEEALKNSLLYLEKINAIKDLETKSRIESGIYDEIFFKINEACSVGYTHISLSIVFLGKYFYDESGWWGNKEEE